MTALLLSRAELVELTDAHRKKAQIDALKVMGIPFHVAPSGWPKVARAVIERRQQAETAHGWAPRVADGKKADRESAPSAAPARS